MRLGACQYCGHCERFICEANAKGTPEVLLYPWLKQQPHFELRRYCQVLGLEYDHAAQRVRGVRYLDLLTGIEYFQPGGVVVLAAFTMTNTKLLLTGRIGQPYDPATGEGVANKIWLVTKESVKTLPTPRRVNLLSAPITTMSRPCQICTFGSFARKPSSTADIHPSCFFGFSHDLLQKKAKLLCFYVGDFL
jgi:hypothetical protein